MKNRKKIFITGGCGFIGTSLVLDCLKKKNKVCNLDNLTYANNSNLLKFLDKNDNYKFVKGDIADKKIVKEILFSFQPDIIINLAAESHVDRSIENPEIFLKTNVNGTFNLLNQSLNYWESLTDNNKSFFRFHHLSTDEVFGSLSNGEFFTEETQYSPSSPYSASKAASDHFVNSFYKTYGLPITISNCSNNYGPYQFPEKLIPLVIFKALRNEKIPIYGNGSNQRDWLFIDDHINAIHLIINKGIVGDSYIVGGDNQKSNLEVVKLICKKLEKYFFVAKNEKRNFNNLITFVKDRPGHDKRYAIDFEKIKKNLNWSPIETFETGIEKTINWYIKNYKYYHETYLSKEINQVRLGLKKQFINKK